MGERAEAFYEHAVLALGTLPGRTLTQPAVVLLTQGPKSARLQQRWRPILPLSVVQVDVPGSRAFVPQRVIAVRRAWLTASVIAGLALLAMQRWGGRGWW